MSFLDHKGVPVLSEKPGSERKVFARDSIVWETMWQVRRAHHSRMCFLVADSRNLGPCPVEPTLAESCATRMLAKPAIKSAAKLASSGKLPVQSVTFPVGAC